MEPAEAQLLLAQRGIEWANQSERAERAGRARQAVAARAVFQPEPLPPVEAGSEWAENLAGLAAHPDYQPFAAQGRTVRLLDLDQVNAVRPVAFWDHAR
jgi:hypothetical protein